MRALLLLSFMCGMAMCQPNHYDIGPTPDSRLALEVFKTGFMSGKKHRFVFERYAGQLTYDSAAPGNSRVELTIESASIVLKDDWLKPADMKKVREHAEKEMLDIARYPRILFSSTKVSTAAAAGFEVSGDLTIRDRSRPATMTVLLQPESAGALKLTGKAQVKLRDYGLKPPSALLGAIGTRDEMAVDFVVFARPRSQ